MQHTGFKANNNNNKKNDEQNHIEWLNKTQANTINPQPQLLLLLLLLLYKKEHFVCECLMATVVGNVVVPETKTMPWQKQQQLQQYNNKHKKSLTHEFKKKHFFLLFFSFVFFFFCLPLLQYKTTTKWWRLLFALLLQFRAICCDFVASILLPLITNLQTNNRTEKNTHFCIVNWTEFCKNSRAK